MTDITILCGHRGKSRQNLLYTQGKSQLQHPHSKHNHTPSMAVDVAPYWLDEPHIRWNNITEFRRLARVIKSMAHAMNIDIVWGGDWKNFKDYVHWELVGG